MKHCSRSEDANTQSLARHRSIRHFAFAVVLLTGCAGGAISASSEAATNGDDELNEPSDDAEDPDAPTPDAAAPSRPKTDAGLSHKDANVPADQGDKSKPAQDAGSVADASAPATDATVPSVNSGTQAGAFRVKDGKIFDGCGEEFVMRGVNHPTIYTDREGTAFPEIAKTMANTVRLFWFGTHGVPVSELEKPVLKAIANGLLPMIEMHDSTCAWNVDPIIEQWIKPDMVALIKKHEKHLLVNIANEASYPNGDEFVSKYKTAITKMRSAGIHVPLVIDGGRCGRDYDTLLNRGKELLEFDPDHNLIFSAHLYDAMAASAYTTLFAKARSLQLPFIVGEFANKEPPGCGKDIDYKSLISEANKAGIGWLAWSWGDNDPNGVWNTDCGLFDMTSTFSFDTLHDWGKEVSVDNSASIKNTAKRPYALQHGDVCK